MTAREPGHTACAVAIDVDGRQRYLFESDKLQEMLGASQIIAETVRHAEELFPSGGDLHLFGPVSGEIRAWALIEHREELLDAAWTLRERLAARGVEHTCAWLELDKRHFLETHDGEAPERRAVKEPAAPSLSWVHGALGQRLRRRKDAKAGAWVAPSCAAFVHCRIHGFEPANRWTPWRARDGEERREQISERAAAKLEAWGRLRTDFYEETLPRLGLERAFRFDDLKLEHLEGQDRYVAFLCADGDDMGKVLQALDWNDPAWGGSEAPWRRNARFSRALDAATREAYTRSLIEVTTKALEAGDEETRLPALPQLIGGDDLWTVARRDVALQLAAGFARAFDALTTSEEVITSASGEACSMRILKEAVARANAMRPDKESPLRLTMSVGVAFTRAGYPAHAMIDAAESLLKRAKSLRKGWITGREVDAVLTEGRAGCLDWHWIQSARSESVDDARRSGWGYMDDEAAVSLTTRPWLAREVDDFLTASQLLKGVARRKLKQLDDVLRLGVVPGGLMWERWWKRLTPEERAAMEAVHEALPEKARLALHSEETVRLTPWLHSIRGGRDWYVTPLLDLLTLSDVTKGGLST